MIVLDASVVLEVLLRTPEGDEIAERILNARESLHAPELIDVEVAQGLRRYSRTGELTTERGKQALSLLSVFPLVRYPHAALLERIWELRHNLTAYDATYVALAEALRAALLTRDLKLGRARGIRAAIEVV